MARAWRPGGLGARCPSVRENLGPMRPGLDTPITYAAPIRGWADLLRAGAGLEWNAAPETTGGDTFKLQVPYSAAGNARPTLGVSIQLEPWGDSTRISVVAHAPADLARRPGARE